MPSARPTKMRARPAISGFSLMAPKAAAPTVDTAMAAPMALRPTAAVAQIKAHFSTSGSVPAWAAAHAGATQSQPPMEPKRIMTMPGRNRLTMFASPLRNGSPFERAEWLSAPAEELTQELIVFQSNRLDGNHQPLHEDDNYITQTNRYPVQHPSPGQVAHGLRQGEDRNEQPGVGQGKGGDADKGDGVGHIAHRVVDDFDTSFQDLQTSPLHPGWSGDGSRPEPLNGKQGGNAQGGQAHHQGDPVVPFHGSGEEVA